MEAAPTTLDHRPARRAQIGWTCATLLVLVPTLLSVVAVVRAWQAPPAPTRTTGRAAFYLSGDPIITVATPSGITQLMASRPSVRRSEGAIVHLSTELALSGHTLEAAGEFDASAVQSVARNGRTLAFAFTARGKEARALLLADGSEERRITIPGDGSWMMGLRAEGGGFAGYVGRLERADSEDPRAALLALVAGRVRSDVHAATVDASGVRLGAPVAAHAFEGKWPTDVMFVDGVPVFVLAGALGGETSYVRPDGTPVALPHDAFTASALRLRGGGGTYVARDGTTRSYRRPPTGLRLCATDSGELEPIDETTSGYETTTRGCGHVLRVRPDARGRYREVQVDDQAWRPLGAGVKWWGQPLADPLGDRWILRGSHRLGDADEVLVFDRQGERIGAPSRWETLRSLAGAPSTAFVAGLVVSWMAAIAAVALLVRALRRLRRVRVGRASPTSPRPGLFTGVLEANGRQLRIAVGGRLIDHVVALSGEWPRRCVFSGMDLGNERVQLVGLLREPPAAADVAMSFREAAPPSVPTLVPATDPPIIGRESAAEPHVSRAFLPLVLALILAVPLSTALLARLGLGPY